MRAGIACPAWFDKIHCVIPWSSHGMTEVQLIHATMPTRNDDLMSTQECH
ncbi:hypothetical protein [Rickettsia endosymbiont of Ixodes pacificus]|nr:hypothetical protein [Rickettsia endosymbiont of Ixodes pacificus]